MHDKGWKRALGMCGEEKEMLKEKNNLFYDKKKRKQACFMSSFFSFLCMKPETHLKKKIRQGRNILCDSWKLEVKIKDKTNTNICLFNSNANG